MDEYPAQTWISPKVQLRDSTVGKGLFAKEMIKNGETVVIWGGKSTDTKGAREAEKSGKLVMQWADDIWSVEDRGDDVSYFINHSCNPNLWMTGISTLIANQEIPKDTELTADYALWEADEKYVSTWKCQCGSIYCRHSITGKDYLLPELQKRYHNHFSQLINRKIANLTKT